MEERRHNFKKQYIKVWQNGKENMKFTAEKDQVMEIYCDWLKNNCDRYEYLTDEARELYQKIKNMDIHSTEAKDYYLIFLTMFINNPFIVASSLWRFPVDETDRSEKQIVSDDYRCYFIKNRFDMWLPLELYCRLVIYRDDDELERVQAQEETRLLNDYQIYENLTAVQEEKWENIRACREENFATFLKGPQEKKSHPIIAMLVICLSVVVLWSLYKSIMAGTPEVFFNAGKLYIVIAAAGALFAVCFVIQGFLEFRNILKKRKVRRCIRQAEELEQEIEERIRAAGDILEDLRDFVIQMLKAGKTGISEPEMVAKVGIFREVEDVYEKYETVVEKYLGEKNIKTHSRFLHIVVLLILVFSFERIGIIHSDYTFHFRSRENDDESEEIGIMEPETDMWRVVVDECNLYQSPEGDVITVLARGEQLEAYGLDDTGQWLNVITEDGTEGYINRRLVKQVREDEIYEGTVYQDTCIADISLYGK